MNTTSLPIGRLLLLLAVLLCLFGDSAVAQKTKSRTKQVAPAQTAIQVARLSAWYSRSPWLHLPGTTMTGVTFPSSP